MTITLEALRAIARRRDIAVWPNHPPRWPGDDAPFLYHKGNVEVGSVIAATERDALMALIPNAEAVR